MTTADDVPTPQVSIEGSAEGDGRVFQVVKGSLNIDYSTHYHGSVEHGQRPDESAAEREPGWEYMLYAATLKEGLASLDGKWLQYRHGHTYRAARYPTRSEAVKYFAWTMDESGRIVHSFTQWLSPPAQEEVFGPRGQPGNASAIQHSAHSMCRLFGEFVDLLIELRSVSIPTETKRARDFVVIMLDQPLRQARQFMLDVIEALADLPQQIAGRDPGSPIFINVSVTFSMDEKARIEFRKELDRLKKLKR